MHARMQARTHTHRMQTHTPHANTDRRIAEEDVSDDLPLTKDRLSQLEEPWPLHTSCQTVENASSSLLVNPLTR